MLARHRNKENTATQEREGTVKRTAATHGQGETATETERNISQEMGEAPQTANFTSSSVSKKGLTRDCQLTS